MTAIARRLAVRSPFALAWLVAWLLVPPCLGATEEEEAKDPLDGLEARLLGPAAGGRVSRVAGVAGDPSTYFAATSAGGVWRSTNGGTQWEPVFDDEAVSSIGSVAVAPSDPNVVWVGTGEANIRGNVAEGNGVYRSTDRGATWTHLLALEGQIGTMAVDPRDADRAYAAVLGSPFGPTEERGVYRTTDGGATWEKTLYVDRDTGASDVAIDPANPRHLFAGTWQTRRTPWDMVSGGPGSGLWQSWDGGTTWKRLGEDEGLPPAPWGKVGVRVAPSDARRVYALVEAEAGGLYRSDDGGGSWELVNASRGLRQRAWYYTTLTVDPTRPDVVWFPQVQMLATIDGGDDVRAVAGGGWDHHDVWIDPADPRRLVVASDAGVSLSWDGGATWTRPPLPISQLYHVATDTGTPYRVLASLQDYGTLAGPSDSLHGGGVGLGAWAPVGGGEAGHVVADPADPRVVWAGEYLGFISRWDGRTGRAANVGIYPENGSGRGAGDLRYRFQWTAPIVVSPHDAKTVYHAANVLFRTTDGGQSWAAISPDLTRDDPEKQRWAGGPITGDNTGVEYYDTIFAVAESPTEPGVIWAGSDDGLVHLTRDAGATWTAVTPPGLPAWATVRVVEPSPHAPGTAWVVADAHRLDDETPYLWVTRDYGASWKNLAQDLDDEVYLHVVREDRERPGVLYLGTERGLQVSWDGGATWRAVDAGLPTVAVVDLALAEDDLVIGTLGRSIWILDDLGPLRDWRPEIADEPLHLFAPAPATRWWIAAEPAGSDAGAGANPPRGASFTYWLKEKPETPLRAEILAADGAVIRTFDSEVEPLFIDEEHTDWPPGYELEPDLTAEPGLHRAAWDLRHDGAKFVPDAMIDIGSPDLGPFALPGTYTLRLTAGDVTVPQPVRVDPDPRVPYDAEAESAQLAYLLALRDRMTEIVTMVATIDSLRDQLTSRHTALADDPEAAALVAAGKSVLEELDRVEALVSNPRAEVVYDILAGREGGAKLYSRYSWLFEAGREHPGPPTQGMREVAAELGTVLAEARTAFDALLAGPVAELEGMARELGVGYLWVDHAERTRESR